MWFIYRSDTLVFRWI